MLCGSWGGFRGEQGADKHGPRGALTSGVSAQRGAQGCTSDPSVTRVCVSRMPQCVCVCVCACIGVCACVCGVFVQRDLCAYVLDTESHMLAHSLCITYFYDSSFFRIFILSRAPRVFNCLT